MNMCLLLSFKLISTSSSNDCGNLERKRFNDIAIFVYANIEMPDLNHPREQPQEHCGRYANGNESRNLCYKRTALQIYLYMSKGKIQEYTA